MTENNQQTPTEKEHSGRAAKNVLKDIMEVTIIGNTRAERLDHYRAQIMDPYRFRVGSTPVHISFLSDGETLENKLTTYFISLKN